MKGRFTRTAVIALALVALAAISAWAVGTPAGTTIRNTAILNYKDVKGNSKAEVTDYVDTIVATKRGVDVSPAPPDYYTVTTEDKVTEYAFTITNTGNATDTIALSVAGSNSLAGWTYEILWDADGDGAWDLDEETDVFSTGPLPASDPLAPSSSYKVIVRVTAPPNEDYNATDTITLTATSQDGAGAAQDTGVINLTLTSADVTIAKTQSTTIPVPLADFTYIITVTNSDLQTAAYNVVVTDTLDTDLVWVSNSTVTGSAVHSAGTVTWDIGTLPADTTVTLTITVHVGEEVPEGRGITNTASVAYEDYNGNDFTDSDDADPGTTQELPGVDISTTYPTTNVYPGDYIAIPFTVTNTGNGSDSFNLSYTDGNWTLTDATTTPIVWTFYDTWNDDGDGIIEPGELSNPATNTGTLAMNGSNTLYAAATVPTNAAYTASSTVTITATSTSDTTEPYTTDSISVTNNVIAPLLTLDKTVDKASAQPGETLTYTLTLRNIGDGMAYFIVVVDAIPDNTTYVPGTIRLNGSSTPMTDAYGSPTRDDYADFNVSNAGAITVTPPNMAPTDILTIEFKVTIK